MPFKYISPVDPSTNLLTNGWVDSNPYGHLYTAPTGNALHTGLDANKNVPVWNADAHSPVYASADGTVTTSDDFAVWGRIIILDCSTDTQPLFFRYAHVEKPLVVVGEKVKQGDQLASVGNAYGQQPWHLHWDVSPTTILRDKPNHWPKLDAVSLHLNYVDPIRFLRNQGLPQDNNIRTVEVTATKLNIRAYPSTSATIAGVLKQGDIVNIENIAPVLANGYHWNRTWGAFPDVVNAPNRWIATDFTRGMS